VRAAPRHSDGDHVTWLRSADRTPSAREGSGRATESGHHCAARSASVADAKLASLPPLGLSAIKQIVRTSWSRTLDQELDLQRDQMRRLGFTHDYREGVAAFLEKRPAKFEGR